MTGVILRRLGATLIVIWGAVSLIFLLVRLAPGDPALVILGPMATPDQLEALRDKLGLNSSLLDQYLIFLGDLLRFDFGDSVRLGRPAIDEVMARLPSTLLLAFIAAGAALVIGIPLGVIAGRRQGGVADRIVSTLALIGKSIPGFWFGLILILVFARGLQVLPSFGSGTPAHVVLPAVTLTLPLLVVIVRLMRASVVDTLREPYITTA
jgi:peptide/nickel transport system permease protein